MIVVWEVCYVLRMLWMDSDWEMNMVYGYIVVVGKMREYILQLMI